MKNHKEHGEGVAQQKSFRWDILAKPEGACYSKTSNLSTLPPLSTTGAHLQHLKPFLLYISHSTHGLYRSESWDCNKDTKYLAEFNAKPTRDHGVWTSSHKYRPSSPEHVYKSLTCHHLAWETSPVYPWKTSNFCISRCCAATEGQLSCVTMQRHALAIMCTASTRPTDRACSASPSPPYRTGH